MPALIIRRIDDGSEIHRVDVSGRTEREIERITMGLLRKLCDDMYIDDSEAAQEAAPAPRPPLAPAEGVEMTVQDVPMYREWLTTLRAGSPVVVRNSDGTCDRRKTIARVLANGVMMVDYGSWFRVFNPDGQQRGIRAGMPYSVPNGAYIEPPAE